MNNENLEQIVGTSKTFFQRLRGGLSRYTSIGLFLAAFGIGLGGCGSEEGYDNSSGGYDAAIVQDVGHAGVDISFEAEEPDVLEKDTKGESKSICDCEPCFLFDNDGDGFGGNLLYICESFEGYVDEKKGLDCNDNNPYIHPGANEVCSDSIDNNCNGQQDEGCPDMSCYYKCDKTVTNSLDNPAINFSYSTCDILVGSICSPDDNGVRMYYSSFVNINDMEVLKTADFLKIGMKGRMYKWEQDGNKEKMFMLALDGLPLIRYDIPDDSDCNPMLLVVDNIVDPITNISIVEDEKIDMTVSFGPPNNFCYSTGIYLVSEISLSSCTYCSPQTDSTCKQCSPTDPTCGCK